MARAFGVMRRRRATPHRSRSSRSRPTRRRSRPARHLPGQHGDLRLQSPTSSTRAAGRDIDDPDSSHDFGKDIIPAAGAQRLRRAQPFELSCVAQPSDAEAPTGATWAPIDPTGTPTSTSPRFLPDSTSTTSLADLHLPASYRRRPSSCTTTRPRGQAVAVRSSPAGCIVSGATVFRSLLFTTCACNSYAALDWPSCFRRVGRAAPRACRNVIIDRGVRIPTGLIVGEDPPGKTPSASAAPRAASAS